MAVNKGVEGAKSRNFSSNASFRDETQRTEPQNCVIPFIFRLVLTKIGKNKKKFCGKGLLFPLKTNNGHLLSWLSCSIWYYIKIGQKKLGTPYKS